MLKNYQRYLAFRFIPPFFITLFFSLAFLLTFQLFRIVRMIIGKDVSFGMFLGLLGNMAVSLLPIAIPLSVLIATIYALNRLVEDSEIVAMRSFGIDKKRLLFPFLVLGMAITLSIWSLNGNIIPLCKTRFKNTLTHINSQDQLRDIQAEHFFTEIPGVTLFTQKTTGEDGRMEDVFIHSYDPKEQKRKVIFAKEGFLIRDDKSALRLQLFDGNTIDIIARENEIKKILFKKYDFPILYNIRPGLITKDSMRTNKELALLIKEKEEEMALRRSKGENVSVDHGLLRSKLEYWSRWNYPLQCLVFVFLGFGVAMRKAKERVRSNNSQAIFIIISHYVLFFMLVAFARKGFIAPVIAVFLPTIAIFEIARRLYGQLD
ncbi:MAG: LptF/LptG family permease [Halobacteriovoraceae bacterium]|nr:LptF/LptG family permease [Halobacteriovoraceae bacterium]